MANPIPREELSNLGSKSRNLVPLYDKYGLDFCLYGHTHLYERSWPMTNDRINTKDGVIYINSGGAGGYIEDFAPTRSWFTTELQAVHKTPFSKYKLLSPYTHCSDFLPDLIV